MHHFRYVGQNLHCESVALFEVARLYGTPAYVYSAATMADNYTPAGRQPDGLWTSRSALPTRRTGIWRSCGTSANLGAAFDFASGGELRRVLAAGAGVKQSVFAGVGKTAEEIEF